MNTLILPEFESGNDSETKTELLFGGDFCPIGEYGRKIAEGREIFDDGLKNALNNSFTVVNLEAPLCSKNVSPDSPGGFGLRGEPKVAGYLKMLGVDVAGFANNHTRDFGDEGVRQTLRNLEMAGVRHTGAGVDLAAAESHLTLELGGLRICLWALAEKELNVASENSAGSSWFNSERNLPVLEKMRNDFDFIVVYLHAGHEFIDTPSPRIRRACRAFADHGADAVVAHHPHVIQGVEKHNNAVIAYSLGNLVFDSPYVSAYDGTDRGYMLRIGVSKHAITEAEVIPYKLRGDFVVSSLDDVDFVRFADMFKAISENITDDAKFQKRWKENVKYRWETDYRKVLCYFSKNMNDPENLDYARRSRNLFACPTHAEIIEKIFLMHEEGKL
ncbi:MAG: CapA family protein, partial [Victivallales bacterium]|nr:CapA family protein [Victivallales bacterium]